MKKVLVGISVVLVALVIFGAGFVFAQSGVASAAGLPAWGMMGGRGGMGGGGQMHDYVEQALADKLGMTKAEVETALDGGKSMAQLAIDKGIKQAEVTALLTEVHKTAFAKAVKDGVLTQAQADSMLQNMTTNGFNFANCPMQGGAGGGGVQGGAGARRGMGGGRGQGGGMTLAPGASAGVGNWNQAQPTAAP